MGLESGTYVSDLISTNPLGTDTKAQGDDHLRWIKSALLATFGNASSKWYFPSTAASQTSTVTVASTDRNKLIPVDASAASVTVNLPAGSGLPDGWEVEVMKTDFSDFTVVITANGTDTLNGVASGTNTLWQSHQTSKLRWSSNLSAWLAKREYIPAKGEITPWSKSSACPTGWLFPNGQTIGDASSSATGAQRNNADCAGLFYHLWNTYSDTVCPVSSGRGSTALADFAAHKTIGLPNLAGRTWVGLDNLGGISDAGVLTATSRGANTAGQTNGEAIGSESNTLSTDGLPASGLSFSATSGTESATHSHNISISSAGGNIAGGAVSFYTAGGTSTTGAESATHTHSVSGTTGNMGSGNAHANIQPSFVSAWKIKL